MNRFRPQAVSKSYIIKQRLHYGRTDNFNWQTRRTWTPVGMTPHQAGIVRRWQQIHHWACHAPACAPHWKKANDLFNQRHLGSTGRGSMRYLNTWSAHSWL